MNVLIIGAGIAGLTTALMLERLGIHAEVYEQSPGIRELGVGINVLPQAINELTWLGLLDDLDVTGIRTRELVYFTRRGQEVWREFRGQFAGHASPQFSIHRGRLQAIIARAVHARLGASRIHLNHRLTSYRQEGGSVIAEFTDAKGLSLPPVRADLLIGADGIHSVVRSQMHGHEGEPRWSGAIIWRGATEWPVFLDGQTMFIGGGLFGKAVVYPIAPRDGSDLLLTNWAIVQKVGEPADPLPLRQDWSVIAPRAELLPLLEQFQLPEVDLKGLVSSTQELWQYPMCDRDPLTRWSEGRVTLIGDAAHPMYPVGSNGASQAILDARALADAFGAESDPVVALAEYESRRVSATASIVLGNRQGGPEAVIDAVESLAPDGFADIDAVLPFQDRQQIVQGVRKVG